MVDIPATPGEFFHDVVPNEFSSATEGVENGPGSICFDVVGEGQWSLAIKDGKLEVSDGAAEDTLVRISFDGESWQAAAVRIVEGGMGPLSGEGLGNLMANPAVASTLKAAEGTLKMVTKTDDGDQWVAITFGGAEPNLDAPRATLTMGADVAEAMQAGTANPQELFMQGKVQIAGDMMMLMQLAPILS
jgi:putative sterol carrier protein